MIYSFVWQQKYTKNRALMADERILYCEKVCDLKLRTILPKKFFIFFAQKGYFLFSQCHKSMFL
jgi:hypothetical protein